MIGETETGLTFPPPALALHVKVAAPAPLNEVLCPEQIEAGVAVIVSVGKGVTLTVTVVLSVHPALLPINVYVAVTVGETTTEVALEPVLHV